jgi:hypothetical protein
MRPFSREAGGFLDFLRFLSFYLIVFCLKKGSLYLTHLMHCLLCLAFSLEDQVAAIAGVRPVGPEGRIPAGQSPLTGRPLQVL